MAEKMNMGIAQTGYNEKRFLRKYRWLFSLYRPGQVQPMSLPSICYIASRPKISFNDQVINHQHETLSFPVRATWEPLDIAFHHVSTDSFFYTWLKQCINYDWWTLYNEIVMGVTIRLVNGIGEIAETWDLDECWPQAIDFGDLDMASNDIAEVRLTLKYTRAKAQYTTDKGGPAQKS